MFIPYFLYQFFLKLMSFRLSVEWPGRGAKEKSYTLCKSALHGVEDFSSPRHTIPWPVRWE